MGFNFSEEDLVAAGEGKVFNNGVAGKVKDVTVTLEKLGVDYQSDNVNAPTFRVVFKDKEGRAVNRACFGIKAQDYPNQWGQTYEQAMKKEWAYLNKLVEHTGGTKVFAFTDDTDLYTKVKAAMGTDKVNVFANYGSSRAPKERIQVRTWLPMVEPASTPDAESKLVAGNIDQMKPIEATSFEDETNGMFTI